MTAEEVDRLMEGATKNTGWMQEKGTGELQRRYEFTYGPEFKAPTGEPRHIVHEWFWVYFNDERRAVRMDRSLFIKAGGSSNGTTTWDLCKRAAIRTPSGE
jgi:hypothetical protein